MEIRKNLTTQNYNAGTISRIKYIVIHYTGNNGDTALANTNYFKLYRGASAHYFVDENNVYQSIEDKNIAWHCGAKSYVHSDCRNHNSIGVELCSYINNKGKYDFKPKTVANAVWLVRILMEKYNVPTERVIRHYDVTNKNCPEPYVRDSKAWTAFKEKLKIIEMGDDEMIDTTLIRVNGKDIKINRILKDGINFIELRGLENAGFNVGYNAKSKLVSLNSAIKELPLIVNGKETSVETVNIEGHNFCPIRSIFSAIGNFDVDFVDNKVVIKTK